VTRSSFIREPSVRFTTNAAAPHTFNRRRLSSLTRFCFFFTSFAYILLAPPFSSLACSSFSLLASINTSYMAATTLRTCTVVTCDHSPWCVCVCVCGRPSQIAVLLLLAKEGWGQLIGDDSCVTGDFVCALFTGPSIGDRSCNNGNLACFRASATISNDSCNNGIAACLQASGTISNGSCNNGDFACASSSGTISNNSCNNGDFACRDASGTISNGSCNNGIEACAF